MKSNWWETGGMTLLEVVMVLMLISILATVGLNRYPIHTTDIFTQTAAIKTHLRYAQLRAMNANIPWGISFNNNTYWLFNLEDMNRPQFLPGETSTLLDTGSHSGLSIELTSDASLHSFQIMFDTLGRPGSNASNVEILHSSRDMTIAISDPLSGNSQTIKITADTGFIP